MALIDDIKARFPDPVPASDDDPHEQCYCIGGALVMYSKILTPQEDGHRAYFPHAKDIARALVKLNPALTLTYAEGFALDIIESTDDGKLWKAWAYAEQALTYPTLYEALPSPT